MRADLDQRIRQAGEATRRGIHAHRSAIDPATFDRELLKRRRRQGLAVAGLTASIVAAGVLTLSRQLPSSPPVIGPAPTGATPTTEDTTDAGQASEVAPTALAGRITDELPAAPIEPRVGHTVVWTGTRMLVWGGSRRFRTPGAVLDDGAAYDPETRTWQPLPAAPGDGTTGHIAVWTGTQMVVAGGEGSEQTVVRYDVDTNTWTTGTDAPFAIHRDITASTWTGARLAVWSPGRGYAEYDPVEDTWTQSPSPPIDAPEDVLSNTQALHAHGELLYAVAGDVGRPVQTAVREADGNWNRAEDLGRQVGTMPSGDRLADYHIANQTVATDAGLLAVSSNSDTIPAALLNPRTGSWTDLAVPGIPSCNVYPKPLKISDGAVIFNYCGAGAYFDARTREFSELELPETPPGGDDTTVWTGHALLTYATACCHTSGSIPHMGSWERPLNP